MKNPPLLLDPIIHRVYNEDHNCHSIMIRPTLKFSLLQNFYYLPIILLIITGAFTLSHYWIIFFTLAVIVLLKAIYQVTFINMMKYEITHKQIKYTSGVFSLRTNYLEMFRIKDLSKDEPFLLRLIGSMNLMIATSDMSHPVLKMKGIPVSNIAEYILELVEMARIKNRVMEID